MMKMKLISMLVCFGLLFGYSDCACSNDPLDWYTWCKDGTCKSFCASSPRNGRRGNNIAYNFTEAREECQAWSGDTDLASVSNKEKQDFVTFCVVQQIPLEQYYWTSLYRDPFDRNADLQARQLQWRWLDGTPYSWMNWHWDDEPARTEKCMRLKRFSKRLPIWKWSGYPCDQATSYEDINNQYVCERTGNANEVRPVECVSDTTTKVSTSTTTTTTNTTTTAATTTTATTASTTSPRSSVPTTITSKGLCAEPAMIGFLVDGSDSMQRYWRPVQDFMGDLVSKLQLGKFATEVSMTQFTTIPTIEFDWNFGQEITRTLLFISEVQLRRGGTNQAEAFKFANEDLFPYPYAKPMFMVLITDSRVQDFELTKKYAEQVKSKGVIIICIGLGNQVVDEQLREISSEDRVLLVKDGQMLPDYTLQASPLLHCDTDERQRSTTSSSSTTKTTPTTTTATPTTTKTTPITTKSTPTTTKTMPTTTKTTQPTTTKKKKVPTATLR